MRKFRGVLLLSFIFAIFCSFTVIGDEQISIIASPEQGNAPLTVAFSLNQTVDSYAWDFNNDGVIDSTASAADYTYAEEGTYIAIVNTTLGIATKTIIVKNAISISIAANHPSGKAPLAVQFTAAAIGEEPLSYSWDFNGDNVVDSTQQNPSTTFQSAGEYIVALTVTDSAGNSGIKTFSLSVSQYDSKLNLSSYFPTTLNQGENQITFIIKNDGADTVKDISAKIIGAGVQHLTSTSIPVLNQGEEDSLTVKINLLQADSVKANLKVLDKNFPISFDVTKKVQYNKEEIQAKATKLKEQLQQLESSYYDKKAQGYMVAEIFDNVKSTQKQIQDVQQQILTNHLEEAKVSLDLIEGAISDLAVDLERAKKEKITIMMWLKENALAITAIVAALGTLSGIFIKLKHQAVKVGEDVKKKFPMKKKEEQKKPEQEISKESSQAPKEEQSQAEESKEDTEKKSE